MATTGGGEETLRWEGVWCCVRSSARGEWTWILRDCSGVARAGRSLAILGPSGSGKTTLLSHLGNHLNADSRKVWVTGEVSSPPHSVAFVPQDAPFFAKLTVRETLVFIAGLEDTGRPSKERVEDVIRRLGLGGCADSVVGGDGGRGISGGERRRLAIACELLRAESDGALTVLIADEPTTGLDSFQADRVVETLVDLARGEGAMVLMCIHQPRSAIFEKLDDVLLLAPGGRTCYAGPASGALAYFAGKGFPCKPNYNPAEFLVDLVSVDTSSKEAERRAWKRIEALHRAWQSDSPRSPLPEQPAMAAGGPAPEPAEPRRRPRRAGLLSQFFHLVGRAFTQTRREGAVHLTRAAGTVVLALAFGTCHFRLGHGQKGIKRRGAVMMQVCINSAMMSTIKTLNSFPRERCVVKKELAKTRTDGSRLYGIGPYFLSKLLVESPVDAFFPVLFGSIVGPLSGLNPRNRLAFLGTLALQGVSASAVGMSVGALAPSTEAALAVGPVVMVLSIMLGDSGGMFAEVPKFLKPAAKFSLIKVRSPCPSPHPIHSFFLPSFS